jgi:deoxyribodipyrimidine photo-lyase
MTQLNKSGFMHNRGRMIVASFLTKLLHIDWRLGEKYFATRLTDYDPANNNGGGNGPQELELMHNLIFVFLIL